MAYSFTLIFSHVFSKKGTRRLNEIFFFIVTEKFKLIRFQQLVAQNYSINLPEILTGVIGKMASNDDMSVVQSVIEHGYLS